MSSNHDTQHDEHLSSDRCIDLVHGLLSASQRRAALAHLGHCAVCEEELRQTAAARQRARSRGRIEMSAAGPVWADAARDVQNGALPDAAAAEVAAEVKYRDAPRGAPVRAAEVTNRTLRKRRIFGSWPGSRTGLMARAAILALAVVALWQLRGPDTAIERLPSDVEILTQRRADAAIDDDLSAGLEAYRERRYADAAMLLERSVATESSDLVRRTYLGHALALDGRFDRAARVLASIDVEQLPEPWDGEVLWTLHVCYEKLGQAETARRVLEQLRSHVDPVGDRARRKLDE